MRGKKGLATARRRKAPPGNKAQAHACPEICYPDKRHTWDDGASSIRRPASGTLNYLTLVSRREEFHRKRYVGSPPKHVSGPSVVEVSIVP